MFTLEFENVTKRDGHEIAVDDISFTVRPGRVTASWAARSHHGPAPSQLIYGAGPMNGHRRT